jgi:hydroxymethylbilane synthase
MSETIRIATRESELALWQANFVRDQLLAAHPGLDVELLGMTTQGDRWLAAPLSEVGGKGLFVKELEVAMLDGHADIAVHSVKDLPAHMPDGFDLPVIAFRDDVEDVLLSKLGGLVDLPHGARVGSSSLRRRSQLLARRADLDVVPIRGNVGTRLQKLDSGEYDAIVLAAAGLKRLGIERDDAHTLHLDICLPAPGQGALGIECRLDAPFMALLAPLKDAVTARCVRAERGVSAGLGADCSLPVAAHASIGASGEISLRALIGSADGSQILRASVTGDDPDAVALDAVQQLYGLGAEKILAELRD